MPEVKVELHNTIKEKAVGEKRINHWHILSTMVCSALVIFGFLLFFSALWYLKNYGDMGFDSVLFTLLSNTNGVSNELLISFFEGSVLPTVLYSGVSIFLLFFFKLKNKWFSKVKQWHRIALSLILTLVFFALAGAKVDFFEYAYKLMFQTKIYEEYYVCPDDDIIKFPEQKKNLIYIFLESMETTYMSKEDGGALDENIIPELTKFAEDNINFSHNDGIGGFYALNGSEWTVAGMVSQTAGIPLKGSAGALENNKYGEDEFLPGVTTLSDILNKNGYRQALMVGSESSFANRDIYYSKHKTDDIYDIFTAREEGVVPEDYYVWWGMEDFYLFDFAKDKIEELADGDKPFAFTLLTVDTHFVDGYVCKLCDDKYEEKYENVISCSSRQVANFISWIQRQSFYDDTTIVICGDHLTMDNQYISRNVSEDYDRTVYNCFINSSVEGEKYKNRTFTSFDLFPTTLAAMGCEIKGERLGLGTSLFSNKETLVEVLGCDKLRNELQLSSKHYIKEFLIK